MFYSQFILSLFVYWTLVTVFLFILQELFSKSRNGSVVIKPWYIRVFSEKLANIIIKYFSSYRHIWQLWFSMGTLITIILIPISTLLLLYATVSSLLPNERSKNEVMEAVIPGVNLPNHEIWYYLLALLFSSLIHEFGHAVSAVSESVKLYGFGFYVFVIIPAAFVELSTEQMMSKNAWRRLRILSAGVWHNIALSIVSALLLIANNAILYPFYSTQEGAVVAYVDPSSGVAGNTGLVKGDIIESVDQHCKVDDKTSWVSCLKKISYESQKGYCSAIDFIEKERFISFDANICCEEDSSRNLCFKEASNERRDCLPVRSLLQVSRLRCDQSLDCHKDHLCLTPVSNNSFKLIEIGRETKNAVLFWGQTDELFSALILTNYKPKFSLLPLLLVHHYETLLRYICSFSMALAVLNAIPCFWLDGNWILDATISLLFKKRFSQRVQNSISKCLTISGTALVFTSVITGVLNVLKVKSGN